MHSASTNAQVDEVLGSNPFETKIVTGLFNSADDVDAKLEHLANKSNVDVLVVYASSENDSQAEVAEAVQNVLLIPTLFRLIFFKHFRRMVPFFQSFRNIFNKIIV